MSLRPPGILLVLTPLLFACGGGRTTEKMTYGGHELEPRQLLFAHVPRDTDDETVLLITDYPDFCAQFDGLGCLDQPLLGTTLLFRFPGFEARTFETEDGLRVRWQDFQGVRPLVGDATAGRLTIEVAKPEEELTGTFDLELPEGRLENGFTASWCKPMRDYYLACSEEGP